MQLAGGTGGGDSRGCLRGHPRLFSARGRAFRFPYPPCGPAGAGCACGGSAWGGGASSGMATQSAR